MSWQPSGCQDDGTRSIELIIYAEHNKEESFMSLTAILIIGAIIFFLPIFVFVALNEHFEWGWGDYDDDTPSNVSKDISYTHTDLSGCHVEGFGRVSGDGSGCHLSNNGYSLSYGDEKDSYFYGMTDGYHGRAHRSDDGEVTIYDENNMPSGYVRNGYTYDRWNLPTGQIRKD